jgi:hypothetical protein
VDKPEVNAKRFLAHARVARRIWKRVAGDLESSPPEFLVEWRITPIEFSQLCEALSGRITTCWDATGNWRSRLLLSKLPRMRKRTSKDSGNCFFGRSDWLST